MKDFGFDTPVERYNTSSLKWDRFRGRDIIPLWVADMDFRSPPPVIRALGRRVEHGVFGYGAAPKGLIHLVCEMLARRYSWQIEPEHLVWLPGLVCGLNIACRSVGTASDEVVTLVPIYPPFLTAPKNSNRGLVTVPLVAERNRWIIDFDELAKSITSKTRLLLFCNPHNPVGRVYNREELDKLVSLCARNDIIICSDEIHCDLILDSDKNHIPTASTSLEAAARTITLMAPSKTFNIPGLGCSFAVISNRQLRNKFLQAMAGIVPEVNILGFTAAEAAYREGWDWLASLLEYLRGNSRLVEKEIASMDHLSMYHVESTYLAWIDARKLDKCSPGRFFEASGVGLSEGSDFGFPGYVRLNFGCCRKLLREALQRMKRATKEKK
ncbi:MAG: aspartate aminotransferase [Desulfobacterales bacterium SG8_35_2]|nr:MAG: aspartate aminotransferase [Desulfobacterales bacterium SG8_35_2]